MLVTQRCKLLPLSETYRDDIFQLYCDENVQRHLGGVLDDEVNFQKRFQEILGNDDAINWAVVLNDGGAFMGMITVDLHHDKKDYEVGFKFFPAYWKQGYAFETISAAIQNARQALQLTCIVAETQKDNAPCKRLLQKLEFQEEGELTRHGETQIFYRKEFAD